MIAKVCLSILLVAVCTMAATIQDANQYVDTVLATKSVADIKNFNLDPATLPDFETEFKDKVTFITVNVHTKYTKGQLTGLARIEKARPCSAPYMSFGLATINCTLSLKYVELKYAGSTKYGKVPSKDINVKTTIDPTNIEIEIVAEKARNQPRLNKFNVVTLGNLHSDFTGLGPMNGFLKGLRKSFEEVINRNVNSFLNQHLYTSLNRSFQSSPMPTP